jgi:hypothetical protein
MMAQVTLGRFATRKWSSRFQRVKIFPHIKLGKKIVFVGKMF